MKEEVEGIKRYLCVYGKPVNSERLFDYELKPIKLSYLHKVFKVDPLESDPGIYDLIDDHILNESQARALLPYTIGEALIDFKKYDYMMETFDVSTCEHSEEYLKALEE